MITPVTWIVNFRFKAAGWKIVVCSHEELIDLVKKLYITGQSEEYLDVVKKAAKGSFWGLIFLTTPDERYEMRVEAVVSSKGRLVSIRDKKEKIMYDKDYLLLRKFTKAVNEECDKELQFPKDRRDDAVTEDGNEQPYCFCPQCGAKCRLDDVFCAECGYQRVSDIQNVTSQISPQPPKKSNSKAGRWLVAIISIIAILTGIGLISAKIMEPKLAAVVAASETESISTMLTEAERTEPDTEAVSSEETQPVSGMDLEYIFPLEASEQVSWYSESTKYYMIPYMDMDTPTILFTVENNTFDYSIVYYANMTDIRPTVNGGLDCRGSIYTASKGSPQKQGTIKVVWDSMETVDFPTIEMIDGNQMTDTSMVASDYSYHGLLENQEELDSAEGMIPDSSSRILNDSDVKDLSDDDLRIAINEIYARHGRMFKDAALQTYFNEQPWYQGTTAPENFDENSLSQIEKDNIKFLQGKKGNATSKAAKKVLFGMYEAKFDSSGGAELEIEYLSGDDLCVVSLNGSYGDRVGATSGYLNAHTDGSDGIWDYYENESYEPSLRLTYDGQDKIVVKSLDGNTFGGMGFPGFEGVYYRTMEYQMP